MSPEELQDAAELARTFLDTQERGPLGPRETIDAKVAELIARALVALHAGAPGSSTPEQDLACRLAALRAASRPSEPLEEQLRPRTPDAHGEHCQYSYGCTEPEACPVRNTVRSRPSAQGHITSAITQLERRRAELLGRGR